MRGGQGDGRRKGIEPLHVEPPWWSGIIRVEWDVEWGDAAGRETMIEPAARDGQPRLPRGAARGRSCDVSALPLSSCGRFSLIARAPMSRLSGVRCSSGGRPALVEFLRSARSLRSTPGCLSRAGRGSPSFPGLRGAVPPPRHDPSLSDRHLLRGGPLDFSQGSRGSRVHARRDRHRRGVRGSRGARRPLRASR